MSGIGQPAAQDDATQASHPSVERMLATAVAAFRAAGEDPSLSQRLARAETTCALHVTDIDAGLTALLDRDPVDVLDGVSNTAESRIYGPSEAWMPVFIGGNLGIALLRGDLEFSGPARKFLRVFPIFRTVYAEVARAERATPAPRGGGAA